MKWHDLTTTELKKLAKYYRQLSAELQRTMLNAIHHGSSIQKLSKDLATRMDVAYRNAERLVRTELNAVENRASADAMREAGFDSYQFMATLDRRTCARCGERDGEIFALKDMNQGENAPPLHPRCRCTIVASLGGIDGGKKIAIDSDGKRIRIPSDMNYRDWKAIYIDKTKALAEWQIEFEARRKADEQSPLRQRGRAIIEQLANSSLPLPKANGNIGAEFDIQRFGTYEDQVRSHGGSGNIKPDQLIEDILRQIDEQKSAKVNTAESSTDTLPPDITSTPQSSNLNHEQPTELERAVEILKYMDSAQCSYDE